MVRCEYIWLDGTKPTKQLRSKVRYVKGNVMSLHIGSFPIWNFDGSSTNQASGHDSDCQLIPMMFVDDPLNESSVLVLCEVTNFDGSLHPSNTRHKLHFHKKDIWIGFEQEYVLMKNGKPLGFPKDGFPAPQGPYYCGNGADKVEGRQIVEEHAKACLDASLAIYGTNSEVLLGQWEFQIGPNNGRAVTALEAADHLWLARFLLIRIAEKYGVTVSFDCKPVKGDWNGSGCHTNFSNEAMRKRGGLTAIKKAIKKLEKNHKEHIAVYGHGLEERLTGLHETCNINEFKSGVANRGASIRIPHEVYQNGYGYFEDRRPGANSNPYEVAAILIKTIEGK